MVGTAGFDELAERYDRYRIGYASELYDALFEHGLHRGDTVLDVGTGNGLVARALTERGCAVTGIDVSERMLACARERVPTATFALAAAEALPFDAASFDAAVSAQTFHWLDEPRALAELERVVRPGGTIAIWWKGLIRGDAVRLVRESVAAEFGLPPTPDLVTEEFEAFHGAVLDDKRLCVVPWLVTMRACDYVGYESSRAHARDAYGATLDAYLERLRERLGPPEGELHLAYAHMLYVGRVPA